MSTNDRDYAVVIGIKDYPAFDKVNPLLGPENDAVAFHKWLVSKKGGGVLRNNTELIISSKYGAPFENASDAKPMVIDIQRAFEKLQAKADENSLAGHGYKVGRRLYIYMSGHGFAPSLEETGLLMANATPDRVGAVYHVLGHYTADWFFKARCFEEIFLFMDCCRELFQVQGYNRSFKELVSTGAVTHVKRLYGLATGWSGLAREKDVDGERRGVFTHALINGLQGAAANHTGALTALSLKNYIYTAFSETGQNGTAVSTEPQIGPDVTFYPNIGEGFTIKQIKVPPKFNVNVTLLPGTLGQNIQVLDGANDFKAVIEKVVNTQNWTVKLPRGKYLFQALAAGRQAVVVVDGIGGVNVTL